ALGGSHGLALLAGCLRSHRARRVADGRSGARLHRPHQCEPGQSRPRAGPDRGDQPLRRAAAPPERGLQSRLAPRPPVPAVARSRDGRWSLDWEELEHVVRLAVRFLDDVIEVNPYPLPEIDATVKANRRIGLGVMGWADLLFALDIPYDSQEALELADRLSAFVEAKGHDQSARLAEERGAFPNWSRSIYGRGRPLRNSTVTTIAPTGTISMIAGCSSGIEPVFALAFEHRVKSGEMERVLRFVSQSFERLG